MERIIKNPENPNLIIWQIRMPMTWDDFHLDLDQIQASARKASEPFTIILHPQGTMPKGDAIAHIKRLIRLVGDSKSIERCVIAVDKSDPVGIAFLNMAIRLFASHNKVRVVKSYEDALELV